eukprot:scaffold49361_cov292-Isochrysis_galbana.AAC.5
MRVGGSGQPRCGRARACVASLVHIRAGVGAAERKAWGSAPAEALPPLFPQARPTRSSVVSGCGCGRGRGERGREAASHITQHVYIHVCDA